MNVPGGQNDLRLYLWSDRLQIVPQFNLVWARVMAHVDPRLEVRDRRMVQADENETRRLWKVHQLCIEPVQLVAALSQRRVAVQRNGIDRLPQLNRIPSPVAHL